MGDPVCGATIVLIFLLAGCDSQKQPIYQNKQGLRFTPPPGWVERARDDAMPSKVSRKRQNVPLPPLGASGKSAQEHLLVEYYRLTSGNPAWLRVTVAVIPPSTSLKACLLTRGPGPSWKRALEVLDLEVSGFPAARIVFMGRWENQYYLSETVAVRKEERVYLITASFPASDHIAREQVRQSVVHATWQH
jgi:hypothetical protein